MLGELPVQKRKKEVQLLFRQASRAIFLVLNSQLTFYIYVRFVGSKENNVICVWLSRNDLKNSLVDFKKVEVKKI